MNGRRLRLLRLILLLFTIAGLATLAASGSARVQMTRGMAMAHLAVHDALNAIDRRYEPYLYDARSEPGAAPGAAVAAAMHDVLVGALVGFGTERAAFRGLTPGERRTGHSAAPSDS